MRRTSIIGALLAGALLVGSATAQAATSFAGTWVATFNKTGTLQMALKGSGVAYTGTYTEITPGLIKKNTPQQLVKSQPLSARVILVNKVPTLFVTLPKQKPPVTFTCTLSNAKLLCLTPHTRTTITFSLKNP